ncbi:MAG: hypothetical protein R2786_00325 [Flavobacteriaceae bacterium]
MELLDRISKMVEKYNWKTDQLPSGTVRVDVVLKLNDGRFRYQWVFLTQQESKAGKEIYMNSRVGIYNQTLLYPMLKKAGASCCYSCLTVVNDTYDGKPAETFVIQSVPSADISDDMLYKILFEVANTADFLEETFYGGDNV